MILLPGEILEIDLASATDVEFDVTVDFFDWNQKGERTPPSSQKSSSNDTTDATILAAPQVSFVREVIRLAACNRGTADEIPTIKTDDGTTERFQITTTVPTGKSLMWERGLGWYVTD